MSTIQALLAEKDRVDQQIAAAKPAAVAQVYALMGELGVTLEDLGAAPAPPAVKRPVKYRDERGNTWTGVGQRPVWLRDRMLAGAPMSQFAVKP